MPPATRRYSKKYGAFKYTKSKGKKAAMAAKRKGNRRGRAGARNSVIKSHAPGGMTHSSMKYSGGKIALGRGYNQMSAPNTLVLQDRRQLIAAFGYQGRASLVVLNSIQDIVQISNLVNKTNGIVAAGGLQQGLAYNAQKFLMEGVEANITMTNQSSCPCVVDLYDIGVKVNPTPQSASLYDVTFPINAWATGLNGSLQTLGAVPSASGDPTFLLGTKPMDSALFRDFYRVNKLTTIELGPTSTHVHKVASSDKKLFDTQEVQSVYAGNVAGSQVNWSTYTRHVMAVVRGNPVWDQTITLPITAPISVLVQVTERYRYSVVSYGGGLFDYNPQYPIAQPAPTDTLTQYSIQSPGVLSPPETLI